jgi:hypothetical protein
MLMCGALFGIPALVLLRRGGPWGTELVGALCAAAATTVLVIFLTLVIAVARYDIFVTREWESSPRQPIRLRVTGRSAQGITHLAALVAGPRHPGLDEEWLTFLAGKSGHDAPSWRKVGLAVTFVGAAIRLRLRDLADATWIPVDAVLKSRKLSNLVVFGPTTAAAIFIFRQAGFAEVLRSAESISAIGGTLYGLVRTGRWWRGVKPPEPRARRARE